ncbi:hypothetical protein GOV08_00225 [Candidatus Woesearchaeota archaeon]|nr:hypothetical protein [Candidatus Woesearchaeota archaeon]
MVQVRQRDFNKSMNKYITDLRRKEIVEKKKRGEIGRILRKIYKRNKAVPGGLSNYQVHVEEKKQGLLKRLFFGLTKKEKQDIAEEIKEEPEEVKEDLEEIKEEYDVLDAAEEEIEKKKEGLFVRFLKVLGFRGREQDIPVEEVEAAMGREVVSAPQGFDEIKGDLREIAKITVEMYQKMSRAKREDFKKSEEFERYKQILEKYDIAKRN